MEFLFQILFTALAGAVAVEMLAYIWPELVIVACIAAAAGYAGAWFATRSFRKTKRV